MQLEVAADREVGYEEGYMKHISTKQLTLSAALAALSATVQLIHIGYQSPTWGMWIDFVAVFWIIAFFLFGTKSAVITSIIGSLVITFFDPTSLVGAIMKWLATFPLWATLSLYGLLLHRKHTQYQKLAFIVIPLILGIILRSIIIIPVNYLFAIPFWTHMSTSEAIQKIPWYIIAGFNTIQASIDVLVAWLLVYKFRLSRYAS